MEVQEFLGKMAVVATKASTFTEVKASQPRLVLGWLTTREEWAL